MSKFAPVGKSKVGIRDVARAAAVSITTVSQALNGKGRFPEETRNRIREIAERLGYQPDPAARSLAGGRSGVIGLAFSAGIEIPLPLTDFDYWNRVIHAATETALQRGYCLVIGPPTPQTDVWERISLDGVVLLDPVLGDAIPNALRKRGTPMVLVGSDPNSQGHDPCVDNDHAAGTTLALEHLWERGARRIALFGYPLEDSFVTTCERSYRAWCARRGVEASVLMLPAAWQTSPRTVVAQTLSAADRPDAVFCLEGDVGIGTAQAAADCGLRIPDDLMIVACTDDDAFPGIPLTTLELDPARTAREAVDLLLDLIEEKPDVERSIEIPVRLVPRMSTDRALG